MTDTPFTPPEPSTPSGATAPPPAWEPPAPPGAWYPPPGPAPRSPRRLLKTAVGVGAAAGIAVAAAAIAEAATGPAAAPPAAATAAASSSSNSSTTTPSTPAPRFGRRLGGGVFGGPGGFFAGGGGPGLGAGGAIYGQETIKGPNGYETVAWRTGTVSSVSDTSGSTWSLAVKSADGTTGTFTVDSSTSVNGGEMGIGSVTNGQNVDVVAVVSNGTATAKTVTDTSTLKANAGTWQPMRPTVPAPPAGSGNSGGSTSGSPSTSGTETPAT